ncbi:MAG TPA: response regulator [Segetibacter sp.]|jgi:CheY-like chemotaxis protein
MAKPIKHIVIADDDFDDIEMFQSAVDETCPDIELTVANDGAHLLSLLETISTPDAILLDLNMPCKTGKECLIEIRTKSEFDDVPIVILSTSNRRDDIDYCLENGANEYIVKPDTFEDMKNIVQNLCDKG